MQQLESILTYSINHYKQILVLLQDMDVTVGIASKEDLLEMNSTLEDIQHLATNHDQLLLNQLPKLSERSDTLNTLIDKRDRLIREVILMNETITSRAVGVKSLLAHELGKLRSGLSAMNGYKQHEYDQGRIVNSTS